MYLRFVESGNNNGRHDNSQIVNDHRRSHYNIRCNNSYSSNDGNNKQADFDYR